MKDMDSPFKDKPKEPIRKYKTKSLASKVLDKLFGPLERSRFYMGGWEKAEPGEKLPVSLLATKIAETVASMGYNPDQVVVGRGSAYSSLSIEYREFTESEEDYISRYAIFEQELEAYNKWRLMSREEKKRVITEIKRQKKLAALQERKNALKQELNQISNEIAAI